MFDERSQRGLWARQGTWPAVALDAALASGFAPRGAVPSSRASISGCASISGWALLAGCVLLAGCATGVDVTDSELAEICAEPGTLCGGAGAVGSVGGSTGVGGSGNGGSFSSNGGTGFSACGSFSGAGGTGAGGSASGASGSGAGGTGVLAEGECLPTDDIRILYRARATAATSNEPSMVLGVENPSGTSFTLSDLTIRYWFTADGTSNFTHNIDYATINGQANINGAISVAFGQEFGSDYAEIQFTSSDTVGAEGVREVQLRFHSDPYQDMDQTNDFSFLASATQATLNRNITPYLSGSPVGGCVPGP